MALWISEELSDFINKNKDFISSEDFNIIINNRVKNNISSIVKKYFSVKDEDLTRIILYVWYEIDDISLREKKVLRLLIKNNGVLSFDMRNLCKEFFMSYACINRAVNELWSRQPPVIDKLNLSRNDKIIWLRKSFVNDCLGVNNG